MKKVLFRADASLTIGSGHVMRCLTLAKELRECGIEIHFVCRMLDGHMRETIAENKFNVTMLAPLEGSENEPQLPYSDWLGENQEYDAKQTLPTVSKIKPDCIIVDHYTLDYKWQSIVKPYTNKIMVIDDLGDRKHECDFLLDQTFGTSADKYSRLVPEKCQIFTGTEYALLRKEFVSIRSSTLSARKETNDLNTILISFGGMDRENLSLIALKACEESALKPQASIHIVVGASNQNHESLIKFIKNSRHDVKLHVNINNIATLMSEADLAIGAGGTTSWERCALGLPSLVVCVADNQVDVIANLNEVGALKSLGNKKHVSIETIHSAIDMFVDHPQKLKEMQLAAAAICDGNGTKRLVASLQNSMAI